MLADNIRKLRKQRHITQRELAKIIEVSPSTVAMWESGSRTPDSSALIKISKKLNISIDWLAEQENASYSIKVPQTENTVTIIGRNGMAKTYILDDTSVNAIRDYTESLTNKDCR